MIPILITIDGPAGSGKSSAARAVAEGLGIVNLNTGAAYRAVALLALREGVDLEDGEALAELDLRTSEVSAAASKVSVHAEVRQVLLSVQRDAARRAREDGGAVVEGRDIGTVVLPDAELKIFLSASSEERARRRAVQSGRESELDRIHKAMSLRDRQDTERQTSPLRPAPDAVVLDTTTLDLEEVVARILDLAQNLRRGP
jgi:cytidylate kinase